MINIRSKIIIIPIVAFFCVGMVLLGIYPYRPNSILSWVVLFLLAFPIVISFEFIGGKLFGNKYVSKLSSPVRILYGIIALLVVIVVSAIVMFSAEPFLGKWGA